MAKEKKYRMKAFLKEDSPQRVFTNYGLTFWRGEWTDLPRKLPKQAMEWLEHHEYITLKKVLISDVTSDVSGREIQIDVIPVMTPTTLKRELEARKALKPRMKDDEMRAKLTELVKIETGLIVEPESDKVEEPKVPEKKKPSKDEIDGMKYRELQKLAKSMGISTKGNNKQLKNRILKALPENEDQ